MALHLEEAQKEYLALLSRINIDDLAAFFDWTRDSVSLHNDANNEQQNYEEARVTLYEIASSLRQKVVQVCFRHVYPSLFSCLSLVRCRARVSCTQTSIRT